MMSKIGCRSLLVLLCLAPAAGCAKGVSNERGNQGGGADGGFANADAAPRPDGSVVDSPDAASGALTLTQSSSMDITAENSVACFNSAEGFTLEASYYRVFDLAALGVTGPLMVDSVLVGIENAEAGAGATQPAKVLLHSLSGALQLANLTEIASVDIDVADQSGTVLEVPISASVPVGTTLVVELLVPDGSVDGHLLFPGSNSLGQSGPTFVRDGCGGAEEPIDLALLDVPDMHWVLAINATL